MATKLDQDFVMHIKKSLANAVAGINALASEVERLEALQEKKDAALRMLLSEVGTVGSPGRALARDALA